MSKKLLLTGVYKHLVVNLTGSEVPTQAEGILGQISVQSLPVQNDDQSVTISSIEGDSDSVNDLF